MDLDEIARRADALERAIAEVERRSRVCVEAARFCWGGSAQGNDAGAEEPGARRA